MGQTQHLNPLHDDSPLGGLGVEHFEGVVEFGRRLLAIEGGELDLHVGNDVGGFPETGFFEGGFEGRFGVGVLADAHAVFGGRRIGSGIVLEIRPLRHGDQRLLARLVEMLEIRHFRLESIKAEILGEFAHAIAQQLVYFRQAVMVFLLLFRALQRRAVDLGHLVKGHDKIQPRLGPIRAFLPLLFAQRHGVLRVSVA